MIQRFAALVLIAGLGTGLVLRILAGRSRFGTFAVLAHAPIVYHLVVTALAGLRGGVQTLHVGAFAVAGAALVLAGALVARRLVRGRPWWAAVTPVLSLGLYLLAAVLPFSFALRAASTALATLPLVGAVLGIVFTVAALLPFAPARPAAGRVVR